MQFNPILLEIGDLIRRVREGKMGLPEFQREFRWKPPAIADLLRTVARKWPAGSFLLLEGPPENFKCKALENAPAIPDESRLEYLILDGQQRMTALFQALCDECEETYYVNMSKLFDADASEEDFLQFERATKFKQLYPSTEKLAAARIIPVSKIGNDAEFFAWTNYLGNPDLAMKAVNARDQHLSGFKYYQMPCVILPRSVPLAAIAKIFETINRTGLRLDAFDLMVAKLYPLHFHLRDEWEKVYDTYPQFEQFGVSGIEILKVIALHEHLRQYLSKDKGKVTVKGVRESDVLYLEAKLVIERWPQAVNAYLAAVAFVKEKCGVATAAMMPSNTMMLPIAAMLAPGVPQREGFLRDLERWLWVATFRQTYSQGANTQAVTDAKALAIWNIDSAAIPEDVRTFRFDSELLMDQRRRNEMLVRGIGCLLAKRGARDWLKTDIQIAGASEPVDFHHVFPQKYLESLKGATRDADIVANICVILASTNKSIRNDPPSEVAKRKEIGQTAVESHAIPWDTFASGDLEGFLAGRRKRIETLIAEATKG